MTAATATTSPLTATSTATSIWSPANDAFRHRQRHATDRAGQPGGAAMIRPGRTAAVVLVTAVIVLSGCSTNPTAVSPGGRTPGPASAAPTAPQEDHDHEHVDPDPHHHAAGVVTAPVDAAAQRAAQQFVTAWARPDLSRQAWLSGVRSRATPAYAAMLETVEPANIPARTVRGPARLVLSADRRADFDVPTDAGPLRVTCVLRESRWLVATIEAQQ